MRWSGEVSNAKCELCHQEKECVRVHTAKLFVSFFVSEEKDNLMLCDTCVEQFIRTVVEMRRSL